MFIEVKLNTKIKNIFILILCTFCTTVLMSGKVDTCIIAISNCFAQEPAYIYMHSKTYSS